MVDMVDTIEAFILFSPSSLQSSSATSHRVCHARTGVVGGELHREGA